MSTGRSSDRSSAKSSERSTRINRVERELFVTLAQFLQHDISTPLPCYASITAVDVSPDLRNAKVYFRLIGQPAMTAEGEKILGGARNAFQKCVARELKMKFCPVLRFEFGKVAEQDDIDVMLENLHKPKHQFGE